LIFTLLMLQPLCSIRKYTFNIISRNEHFSPGLAQAGQNNFGNFFIGHLFAFFWLKRLFFSPFNRLPKCMIATNR